MDQVAKEDRTTPPIQKPVETTTAQVTNSEAALPQVDGPSAETSNAASNDKPSLSAAKIDHEVSVSPNPKPDIVQLSDNISSLSLADPVALPHDEAADTTQEAAIDSDEPLSLHPTLAPKVLEIQEDTPQVTSDTNVTSNVEGSSLPLESQKSTIYTPLEPGPEVAQVFEGKIPSTDEPTSMEVEAPPIPSGPPSPPSNIISAWDRAMDIREQDPHAIVRLNMGEITSLGKQNTIELIIMPPGTRLQRTPHHTGRFANSDFV
jgi:hypothetical protein